MNNLTRLFSLLSDESRLRIFILLSSRELCVCQLMGVLGISQPLVSRNLSLLNGAGLLEERREGKLVFYSVRKDMPPPAAEILSMLKRELKDDKRLKEDLTSAGECYEFQKLTGRCDMKTFLAFMNERKGKRRTSPKSRETEASRRPSRR
jgi:ArsR family transcriptional regulator